MGQEVKSTRQGGKITDQKINKVQQFVIDRFVMVFDKGKHYTLPLLKGVSTKKIVQSRTQSQMKGFSLLLKMKRDLKS